RRINRVLTRPWGMSIRRSRWTEQWRRVPERLATHVIVGCGGPPETAGRRSPGALTTLASGAGTRPPPRHDQDREELELQAAERQHGREEGDAQRAQDCCAHEGGWSPQARPIPAPTG